MTFLTRFIPFAGFVASAAVLEAMLAKQEWFWYLLPLPLAIAIFPIGLLARWRVRSPEFWEFLLTPFMLLGGTLFLFLFLTERMVAHLLVAGMSVLFGWYCENVFLFFYRTKEYQTNALEHISLYAGLLSVFFIFSSLYAARVFLNVSVFVVIPIAALVSVLFAVQLMLNAKVSLRGRFSLFGVASLVLLEWFFVIMILPTTMYVAGLLMTILFYLMMSFTRHAVRHTLSRRVFIRNTVLGSLTIVTTLLTAPWS